MCLCLAKANLMYSDQVVEMEQKAGASEAATSAVET
jgi:hypothetical protein